MELIEKFFPSIELIYQLAFPLFIIALAAAMLSGWLKIKIGWRTPYTRKTFHFIIFSTAGYLQFKYGLKAVSLFGVLVSAIVLLAVILDKRWWFYSALARETDAPHKKNSFYFHYLQQL